MVGVMIVVIEGVTCTSLSIPSCQLSGAVFSNDFTDLSIK